MSIKVYNGYILRNKNLNEAFCLINSIQKKAIEISKTNMKNVFSKMLESQTSGDKSEGIIAIFNLFQELKQRIIVNNQSIPSIDYTCQLVLIPYKNDIMILKYTEQRDLYEGLFKDIGIESFYYWNNTDKPEEISEAHWSKREIIWKETGIFEVGAIPSQKGLTYELVTWSNYDNLFDYQ